MEKRKALLQMPARQAHDEEDLPRLHSITSADFLKDVTDDPEEASYAIPSTIKNDDDARTNLHESLAFSDNPSGQPKVESIGTEQMPRERHIDLDTSGDVEEIANRVLEKEAVLAVPLTIDGDEEIFSVETFTHTVPKDRQIFNAM